MLKGNIYTLHVIYLITFAPILRQQPPCFGDIGIAFPPFISVQNRLVIHSMHKDSVIPDLGKF